MASASVMKLSGRSLSETGALARDWEEQQQRHYEEQTVECKARQTAPKTWVIEVDGKRVGYQDGSWSEVKVGVRGRGW